MSYPALRWLRTQTRNSRTRTVAATECLRFKSRLRSALRSVGNTLLSVAMSLEGHAMADHIHLVLSIPPKHSVARAIGFLKGKSAVRIHGELLVSAG